MGAVALVQGDRIFPSFEAMLDVTVAAAPHRDRKSLRRGVFHNSKHLDDGTWTWRYDSFRKGEGFEGLWDDVPGSTMPTTLVRGANSYFRQRRGRRRVRPHGAPGFQRRAHRRRTPATRCRAISRARWSTSCAGSSPASASVVDQLLHLLMAQLP